MIDGAPIIHLSTNQYDILVSSPTGAGHVEKNKPCQDAVMAVEHYFRGEPIVTFAIADGHGSEKYTRSDIGSHLAVEALYISAMHFCKILILENPEEIELQKIRYRFERTFIRNVILQWHRLIQEDNKDDGDNDVNKVVPLKTLYGTTLTYGFVCKGFLFTGQIGDGAFYKVSSKKKKITIKTILPNKESLHLGSQTDSLSSDNAQYTHQHHIEEIEGKGALFLSTDGIIDSLHDTIHGMIQDVFEKTKKNDYLWLKKIWTKQLVKWSDEGTGDDMGNIIIFYDTHNKKGGN